MLYVKTNSHGEIVQTATALPTEQDDFAVIEDAANVRTIIDNFWSGIVTKLMPDGELLVADSPRPSPHSFLTNNGTWSVDPNKQAEHDAYIALDQQENSKRGIRAQINYEVGDIESRAGRMANVLSILVPLALVDVAALDPDDAKDAAKLALLSQLYGVADVQVLAKDLLEDLKSGALLPTFAVYGLESVLREAMADSTKAVPILQEGERN